MADLPNGENSGSDGKNHGVRFDLGLAGIKPGSRHAVDDEGSPGTFSGGWNSEADLVGLGHGNIGPSMHGESAYYRRAVLELLFFSSKGDLKRCKRLQSTYLKDLSKTDIADYDKRTPLHLAASDGCYTVMQWLLENGVDVNALDRWKRTPLEDAVRGDHGDVAKLLLEAGGLIYEDGQFKKLEESRLSGVIQHIPSDIYDNDPDWEIEPSTLDFGDTTKTKLGEGEFGVVYKAMWHGTCVAAKVLKVTTEFALGDFRTEVEVLRKVHHPNAVQFLGACTKKEPYILVTELMHGGSLADAFRMRERSPITLRRALEISIDCARGLAYMHCRKNGVIIHRDLKPGNLMIAGSQYMPRDALITNIGTFKLADFGLSKSMPKQDKHANFNLNDTFNLTGETGSYRYMAPEVFIHDLYNHKVDVYSFAMIIYQLFEGIAPFAGIDPVEAARLAALSNQRPHLIKLKSPVEVMKILRKLVERCWAKDPEQRPDFEEIVRILREVMQMVPRETPSTRSSSGV